MVLQLCIDEVSKFAICFYELLFFRLSKWRHKAEGRLQVSEDLKCQQKVSQDFAILVLREGSETAKVLTLDQSAGFTDMAAAAGAWQQTLDNVERDNSSSLVHF